MPRYSYTCEECHHSFDRVALADDKEQIACPSCGNRRAKRLPAAESVFGGISNFSSFGRDTS